jgi:hypothetical protein
VRWQDALAAAFFLALLGGCAIWFAGRIGWPAVWRLIWLVILLPIGIAAMAAAGRKMLSAEPRQSPLLAFVLLAAAAVLGLSLVLHLAGLMIARTPLREIGGL